MKNSNIFSLPILIILIIFICISGCSNEPSIDKDQRKIVTKDFEIDILAMKKIDSLIAYGGAGTVISHTRILRGEKTNEINILILEKDDEGNDHSYTATELNPKSNIVLIETKCKIKNISNQQQPFLIGDINLLQNGRKKDFCAVGLGDFPFHKSNEDKEKVKKKFINIEPYKAINIIYIFAADKKEGPPLRLTYKEDGPVETIDSFSIFSSFKLLLLDKKK